MLQYNCPRKCGFRKLEPNDILFIDSSHVVKTGSDVQHIFFKILPEIKSGVYIHFHDVFYPFEYPKHWIFDNHWSWNEYYFLMAFLMYNTSFKIVLSTTYLSHYHEKVIKDIELTDDHSMEKYVKDRGFSDVDFLNGCSIWLKKILTKIWASYIAIDITLNQFIRFQLKGVPLEMSSVAFLPIMPIKYLG